MTITETAPTEHEADHDEHEHPSDGTYVKVALILGVLTAIEVGSYFAETGAVQITRDILVPVIMVIMVIKFVIVALYFMHLKFDDPLLRRLFAASMVISILVFCAALAMMHFWDDSGLPPDYPENLRLVDPTLRLDEG